MTHGMENTPIYRTIEFPAYQLRYNWTGWPSGGRLPKPPEDFFQALATHWELDGIRPLEWEWTPERIQLLCSVKPMVSPVRFTQRVKGRIQNALRKVGAPTQFKRKLAFRSVGNNTRQAVEQYIAEQVTKAGFVDERFASMIRQFTTSNPNVSLANPTITSHGRYWYNLHVVLVTDERRKFTDVASLTRLANGCDDIAKENNYLLSRMSIMPDHLHLAMRGDVKQSPEEIALTYMNDLALALGGASIWQPGYYVGTFGEYDMAPVRR